MGVDRESAQLPQNFGRFLHVCGGVPLTVRWHEKQAAVSPHVRGGVPRNEGLEFFDCRVSLTSVGVDHAHRGTNPDGRCFPHVCGGVP